jgi:ribosomal protein S18 acetylase RimI-like enzyme
MRAIVCKIAFSKQNNEKELVGAICCQSDAKDYQKMVILTLAVYAPFRRRGIGLFHFFFCW